MKSKPGYFYFVLLMVLLLALPIWNVADNPPTGTIALAADYGQMPLVFVANQGQVDEPAVFYVQGRDKTLYFTPEGVTFSLVDPSPGEVGERWIVKLDFLDANAVLPVGQEQAETVVSYFKGSPHQWHTGVPTFSRIVYANLWAGIDLVYSGTVNQLKYEFVVQPGVDPARIRMAYRGATLRLDEAGRLEVSTPVGGFTDDVPVAYQEVNGERTPVEVSFLLDGDITVGTDEPHPYRFRLGAYDPTLPLVIDPVVLVYCGYVGGSGLDGGKRIALDSAGNAYITGYTHSNEASFPVTVGPDLTFNGGSVDAFVVKVKADGSALVYAGYIGGSGYDEGWGIAVDTSGHAYVAGGTASNQSSFPVTVGPDLTFNGSSDAFVARLNPEGTALLYAGYIGGSSDDGGRNIAIDNAGNAYIVGSTESTQATFPVTVGPDLTFNGGFRDVFVAKVRADGSGLWYAGYIGGSSSAEYGSGIAVDAAGYAYVVGDTSSTQASFPVTVGPDLTHNGGSDAFIAKIALDGSSLVYCGYLGGDDTDLANSVVVDTLGNAFITGQTYSTEATFPVIGGPDLTYNSGGDAFVAKVMADGSGLVYAGYIGGVGLDTGLGIAMDTAGYLYITGETASTETTFPVIIGPDLTHNGKRDAFVAKIQPNAMALVYAGYIGGEQDDSGKDIAVDAAGSAYVVGETKSNQSTFPVTTGPDLTFNSTTDAFVAKVSPSDAITYYLYLPMVIRH